jgi:hypothetical protein
MKANIVTQPFPSLSSCIQIQLRRTNCLRRKQEVGGWRGKKVQALERVEKEAILLVRLCCIQTPSPRNSRKLELQCFSSMAQAPKQLIQSSEGTFFLEEIYLAEWLEGQTANTEVAPVLGPTKWNEGWQMKQC